jgi:uncharacterized membrane protein
MGAMPLALACAGWLLFFIHHISCAISVNHIVDWIASETEASRSTFAESRMGATTSV